MTQQMTNSNRWDVIVAGAGPAGATTAALLAKRGVRVLVLERERFPRFHIGESLLPAGLPVHDELGLSFDDSVLVHKGGARFVCEATQREAAFDFSEGLPGCPTHAWHVDRASFDVALRDRALALGATVRHGVSVESADVSDDEVVVATTAGTERARFFIDATGQDRFLAKKQRSAEPFRVFGKAAVYTHFDGLTDDAMAAIGDGNDIRIVMVDEGWAWMIPLPGRRLSLGLVSQKRGIGESWLDEHLAGSALAQKWTAGAVRGATRVTSNFSFRNTASYGPRFACVGDAACFLDPVFSSGVTFAMRGGSMTADVLARALQDGTEAEPDMLHSVRAEMDRAYATLVAFIDRFYNRKIVENLFFGAPESGDMRSAVVSVLAGDVWRRDNPFQEMLLKARRQPSSPFASMSNA